MAKLNCYIEGFTCFLLRYPKRLLLGAFIVTILLASQARHVHFDTSMVGFLDVHNPQRIQYNKFKNTFGLSEYFIVLIETDAVFDADFLTRLAEFERDINDDVLYLARVESILSVRSIRSIDGEIQIAPLFEQGISDETLAANKQFALSNSYYLDRLVNHDANLTALIIELQPNIVSTRSGEFHMLLLADVLDSYQSLDAVVQRWQDKFQHKLYLGGTPAAAAELNRATKHDLLLFTALSLLLIATCLWLVFRNFTAVFAPLLILTMTVTVTISLMLIGKFPMQVTSSLLPSFLLAVCIGDAVHLMQNFYRFLAIDANKRRALEQAINHTFMAMFYTTLTTSLGLLSFSNSGILPVASFGLFSALGVWVALLFTYACLPSLILLSPSHFKRKAISHFSYDKAMVSYVAWLAQNARRILLVVLVLFAGSIYYSSQLKLSHDSLAWFKDDNPVRVAVLKIDEKLSGTMAVELLVDSGKKNGIYNAQLVAQLEQWLDTLKQQPLEGVVIRSSVSLLDSIKEVHRIVIQDEQEQTLLPTTNALLAQEVLLLEVDAADQVSKYVDENYQILRITLTTPWQDAVNYTDFISALQLSFEQHISADSQLGITGMVAILNRTITEMLSSMAQSYLLAGVMVSFVMILLLRSLKMGLLMMLPNLLPIVGVMAIMYFLQIPLDMFTLLIGSIAIGLIVDDSVHFIYGFQHYYKQSGQVEASIVQTFLSAGKAMMTTTFILCAGFSIYCFSYLNNLQNFGILTALCIFLALIADFLIAPALILILYNDNNK